MNDDNREIAFYVEERRLLLEEREKQEKLWRTNHECLNKLAREKIISLGLYQETFTLVKRERIIYSEKGEQLILPPGKICKNIRDYLKGLGDIGSLQYLHMEDKVTFRVPPRDCQPWIEFTQGADVKDFIRRNKIKIINLELENEIKRLQEIKKEYEVCSK